MRTLACDGHKMGLGNVAQITHRCARGKGVTGAERRAGQVWERATGCGAAGESAARRHHDPCAGARAPASSLSRTAMSRQARTCFHATQMSPFTRRGCMHYRHGVQPCIATMPLVSGVQRRQGNHALAEDLLIAAARAAAAALDDPSTVHHLTPCSELKVTAVQAPLAGRCCGASLAMYSDWGWSTLREESDSLLLA